MRNERERIVTERVYDALNERIYEYDHPSGLHIQIIPKRGYRKNYQILGDAVKMAAEILTEMSMDIVADKITGALEFGATRHFFVLF